MSFHTSASSMNQFKPPPAPLHSFDLASQLHRIITHSFGLTS